MLARMTGEDGTETGRLDALLIASGFCVDHAEGISAIVGGRHGGNILAAGG